MAPAGRQTEASDLVAVAAHSQTSHERCRGNVHTHVVEDVRSVVGEEALSCTVLLGLGEQTVVVVHASLDDFGLGHTVVVHTTQSFGDEVTGSDRIEVPQGVRHFSLRLHELSFDEARVQRSDAGSIFQAQVSVHTTEGRISLLASAQRHTVEVVVASEVTGVVQRIAVLVLSVGVVPGRRLQGNHSQQTSSVVGTVVSQGNSGSSHSVSSSSSQLDGVGVDHDGEVDSVFFHTTRQSSASCTSNQDLLTSDIAVTSDADGVSSVGNVSSSDVVLLAHFRLGSRRETEVGAEVVGV